MRNKTYRWLFIIVLRILFSDPLAGCTGISASRSGEILAGQNWDWKNPDIYLWFVPPEKAKYGCVFFGLKVGYPAGGMNDQGLVVCATLTPGIHINRIEGKKTVATPLEGIRFYDFLSRHCATVDEVIKEIKHVNLGILQTSHILVTDRSGASAIIEGDDRGNPVVLRRDSQISFIPDNRALLWKEQASAPLPLHLEKGRDYNIITNFLHSQVEQGSRLGGFPCRRYNFARRSLGRSNGISPSLFRGILEKTHLEGEYPTKLSAIFDLKRGEVYLYYLHNFNKEVHFKLDEELKKGFHHYNLKSLFRLRWHPLFLSAALLLFFAVFVFPAKYIYGMTSGKKQSPAKQKDKYFTASAYMISVINSILVLILIYRFPYILSHQLRIIRYNLVEYFFIRYGEIFSAILILSLMMLLFTVFVWIRKKWTLMWRLYYTLVLIAISAILTIMV
jgi:hypothetical protein